MAIKTFINGQENGVITYVGDTEPCAVYVNRERQDNISYIPTLAEGADSVSYKSEYKNNLRTLQIDGNTEQGGTYQAVEYIESTGTQYIDTGILGKSSLRIVVKTNYAEGALLGTQSNADTNKSIAIVGANGEYVRFMESGGTQVNADYTSKPPYEIDLSIANFKITSNDGQSYTSPLNGTSTTIDYPMYVFARNIDGQASGFSKRKVYSLKIYDNGTLVRDYMPCYRKSDNVIGLYDLVNGVFYTNAGTGTFLKGADVTTTVYPTIANSRAITNCGNNNIEVVARGVNLFDIDNPFLVADNSWHLNYPPKIEDGIIYGGGAYGSSDGAYLCIKTDGKSKYTITYNCDFNDTTETVRIRRVGLFSDVKSNVAGKFYLHNRAPNITKGKHTIVVDCQGYEYIGITWFSNTRYGIKITDLQIEKGDDATPYEPYFNSTVTIPANVVLESGANDTLLELAKIGDVADTITIDRVNNEVKYTQRICRVRPFVNVGGTLMYESYDSQYYNVDLWWFTLNKPATLDVGKCEFAKVDTITEAETDFCVEIGNTYMYIGIPKSLGLNSPEALDSYLMQTGNFGLSIFYALEEPIEWDLSTIDKTLSDNLLEWARNTKNQTNIIEITSTPSVSKTSVNYAKWGGVPNENNT